VAASEIPMEAPVINPFAQDVEDSLLPLIKILEYCLPVEQLVDIAKDMCAELEESFSKGIYVVNVGIY